MSAFSRAVFTCVALLGAACNSGNTAPATRSTEAFVATPVAQFSEPWAMTFLPDGRLLVTEKKGALKLLDVSSGKIGDVGGVPRVAYGGQGGFGDVILHPGFGTNRIVYVSYAEAGVGGSGGAVARGTLALDANGGGKLEGLAVIWRQVPKVEGQGHFGHRLTFGPDGKLWITSSERQKFTPAQDMKSNLGKIVRVDDDGSVPADNPFATQGGVTAQIWSLGHRNMLGISFDGQGRLFAHEMGPRGGDELNIIEKGANYGYPVVSNGDHYNGRDIPDHPTRPEFKAPLVTWNPVISPAGFVIYTGNQFPKWQGSGFIGGLSSQSLVRVELGEGTAREAQRFDMGRRIREVEQGPDGAIWLLEDGVAPGGRLLKLTPK
jgi:aldose sugar dehydrogenase